MRGLLCFLLLFALTVNMNARPQADTRITLKLDNVTLTKAMNEIKQQSRFLFINKGVDASKIVSINVESETINNVCKALFTPVNVAFTIEGNNIIITNANVNDKKGGPVTITGTIRDASGGPVPGAGTSHRNHRKIKEFIFLIINYLNISYFLYFCHILPIFRYSVHF